jgi:hypothetical protein
MLLLESIWIFQIDRQCAFDVSRLPKGPESRNYALGNIMKNKQPDKRAKNSFLSFSIKLAKTIFNSFSARSLLCNISGKVNYFALSKSSGSVPLSNLRRMAKYLGLANGR